MLSGILYGNALIPTEASLSSPICRRQRPRPQSHYSDLMSLADTLVEIPEAVLHCKASSRFPSVKLSKSGGEMGFKELRSGSHMAFKKQVDNRVLGTWVPHHRKATVFVSQQIIKLVHSEIEV